MSSNPGLEFTVALADHVQLGAVSSLAALAGERITKTADDPLQRVEAWKSGRSRTLLNRLHRPNAAGRVFGRHA